MNRYLCLIVCLYSFLYPIMGVSATSQDTGKVTKIWSSNPPYNDVYSYVLFQIDSIQNAQNEHGCRLDYFFTRDDTIIELVLMAKQINADLTVKSGGCGGNGVSDPLQFLHGANGVYLIRNVNIE